MKGTHFLPAMPCIRMASALKLYAFGGKDPKAESDVDVDNDVDNSDGA
jgi:hypothetical protein